MAYNRKDFFFHQAKKDNFVARSIYKLEEIDQRMRILKPNWKVLDLGCAPGSWAQYVSKKVGHQGRLLGIDLQAVKLTLPNAVFIQADLRALDLADTMKQHGIEPPFDAVISDMAPRTIGIKVTDQARSLELCDLALDCADRFLRVGGNFVVKMFHSDDFEDYRNRMRKRFEKVEILRPKSTRKESKEIFLIGLGYKGVGTEGK